MDLEGHDLEGCESPMVGLWGNPKSLEHFARAVDEWHEGMQSR